MGPAAETERQGYVFEAEIGPVYGFTLYQGRRQADGAAVILKVVDPLLAADETFTWRFTHLTRQIAQLEHPNILATSEAEQAEGRLFVVQEFVEARSLAEVIEAEGPFSPRRMQLIARQIASTLDYAHQKSVTHGELSAQCIYLTADDHVLVADFGLFQALFGLGSSHQPYSFRSPETMAPERVRGQGPSRQSDLYALGILCYQMLAKKPPFSGAPSAVLHAQAYRQPRPVYLLNPGIPQSLSEVISRMLAKGMELRYNTGAEFARALAAAAPPLQQGRSFNLAAGNLPPAGQRAKFLTYAGTALFLALLLAGSLLWVGYTLGVRQAARHSETGLNPAPASGPVRVEAGSAPDSGSLLPTATARPSPVSALPFEPARSTPTRERGSLSDTLVPTAPALQLSASLSSALLLTPTPGSTATAQSGLLQPATPRPVAPVRPAAARPTPSPVAPAGKGLLLFRNPTGHDLVVDLTGPTAASVLVPPYQQASFVLVPGTYQCMIHTPTGAWLASRTLQLEIAAGEVVERDYYSDYDLLTSNN